MQLPDKNSTGLAPMPKSGFVFFRRNFPCVTMSESQMPAKRKTQGRTQTQIQKAPEISKSNAKLVTKLTMSCNSLRGLVSAKEAKLNSKYDARPRGPLIRLSYTKSQRPAVMPELGKADNEK